MEMRSFLLLITLAAFFALAASQPRFFRRGRGESLADELSLEMEAGATDEDGQGLLAKRQTEDGGDVPEWCDPATELGAWLNFKNVRKICADRGFTNFGAYGGVPSDDEEAAE